MRFKEVCVDCKEEKEYHHFLAFGRFFPLCKDCRILENKRHYSEHLALITRMKLMDWITPVPKKGWFRNEQG